MIRKVENRGGSPGRGIFQPRGVRPTTLRPFWEGLRRKEMRNLVLELRLTDVGEMRSLRRQLKWWVRAIGDGVWMATIFGWGYIALWLLQDAIWK